MKRITLIFAISFIAFIAVAEKFEVDGLCYEIISSTEKTCQVISKEDKYSGDITIPSKVKYNGSQYTVTAIFRSAFSYNTNLSSIVIPNTVTEIGESAFKECSNLKSVDMSNSVKIIKREAFKDCRKLLSISIPKSVEEIQPYAFDQCSVLNAVYIEDISAWFKIDFDGYNSNPLEYAHNLYVDGKLVTNLEIPSNIKTIKQYALIGCTSVMSQ